LGGRVAVASGEPYANHLVCWTGYSAEQNTYLKKIKNGDNQFFGCFKQK